MTALPIIHKLLGQKGAKFLRALVLCPTRELAKQVLYSAVFKVPQHALAMCFTVSLEYVR